MGGDFVIPVKYCIAYEEQSMMDGAEVVVNKYTGFNFGQMHTHTFIEICCVTEGSGWHILNDSLHRCSPGDLFIIDVSDAHVWIAEHDSPMTIYNLIIRPGFFDASLLGRSAFSDLAGSFLLRAFSRSEYYASMGVHFDINELPGVRGLYERMLDEYTRRAPGFLELIRSWAVELLVDIFRKHDSSSAQPQPGRRAAPSSLTPVFDYINLHFAEDISLRQLSALVFLSPSYFSRVFRLYTGQTVTDYIQRVRAYNARSQLLNTNLSVAAIAEANGYSDPKYFTRIFRRIFDISPSEYRAQMHKKRAQ